MSSEHKLYLEDRALWASMLFFKYSQGRKDLQPVRDALRAALGEEGMTQLTEHWKEAKKDGVI